MASTNFASKLSRAICHYIVSEQVVPFDRAYHSMTRRTDVLDGGPIVAVDVDNSGESVDGPGNQKLNVRLNIRGSAVKHPDDTNDETERLAFDAFVGGIKDVIFLSDDDGSSFLAACRAINTSAYEMPVATDSSDAAILFAANNADMNEFTLMWMDGLVINPGLTEDTKWETVIEFSAIVCESKITGYTN